MRGFDSFRTAFRNERYLHAKSINVELHTPFCPIQLSLCLKMPKICSKTNSKVNQRTKFRNGFLNRRCCFTTEILGLIDAVSNMAVKVTRVQRSCRYWV